jgi:hypothetical protein
MPNTLLMTNAIPVANIRQVRVLRLTEVDEDNKRMIVELVVSNAGGTTVFPPLPFRLEITNTACDGLVAHPLPSRTEETLLKISLTVAGAFDTCLAAYQAVSADRRGAFLTALKAVNGVVNGGILNGTAQNALPAGAVS